MTRYSLFSLCRHDLPHHHGADHQGPQGQGRAHLPVADHLLHRLGHPLLRRHLLRSVRQRGAAGLGQGRARGRGEDGDEPGPGAVAPRRQPQRGHRGSPQLRRGQPAPAVRAAAAATTLGKSFYVGSK